MQIQNTQQESNLVAPYNACDRCWNGFQIDKRIVKRGQYSEFAVYIYYKDKPNQLLCYKCLCTTCGNIKLWGEPGNRNSGYFYQRLNDSNLIDLNIRNWFIVKKLNLNPNKLEELLLAYPRRNHFTPEELPKIQVNDISDIDINNVPF